MLSKRKSRRTSSTSGYSPLSEQKTKAILRDLPLNLAFHFYEDIDKPTGQVATSLLDFCNKLASAQSPQALTSLIFHMERGDFVAWIRNTIGDSELADKIAQISTNDRLLAKKLHQTVEQRIKQLKETLIEHSIIPEDQTPVIRPEWIHS